MGFWLIKQAFKKRRNNYILFCKFIFTDTCKSLSDVIVRFGHYGPQSVVFFASSTLIKTASATSEQKESDDIAGFKPFPWE